MSKASDSLKDKDIWGESDDLALDEQIAGWDLQTVQSRTRMLESNIKIMRQDATRYTLDQKQMDERIKENNEKIKMNKQLPYLVANVIEVCSIDSHHKLPAFCWFSFSLLSQKSLILPSFTLNFPLSL
jgi:ATP-dependent 26S proteasome regulatory subunit